LFPAMSNTAPSLRNEPLAIQFYAATHEQTAVGWVPTPKRRRKWSDMYKPKKYFVVATETDDEREAIETAWKLQAKFVFDTEKNGIATIITDKNGSRLKVYPNLSITHEVVNG